MELVDKAIIDEEINNRIRKWATCPADSKLSPLYGARCVELSSLAQWLNQLPEVSTYFNATVCKKGDTYLKRMNRDAIVKALESFNEGDKVRVIIVKA